MSKGMWTKQYTVDGRVFYFNAGLNKSVWALPSNDVVVHEAPFLRKPESNSSEILEPATSLLEVHSVNAPSTILPGQSSNLVTVSEQPHAYQSSLSSLPPAPSLTVPAPAIPNIADANSAKNKEL
jgi:hypothetical protein